MKRAILTGVIIMGIIFGSCNRYSYHEQSFVDKNANTTVHNVNNIFN